MNSTSLSFALCPRNCNTCPWNRFAGISLLAATAAMLCAPAAVAAETERLAPVVVTARAWQEPTENLPSSVAIWWPATDVWGLAGGIADLAWETPGVDRTADGPWSSDLSIRGLSGDRIVVTLDGARLVTATDLAARMALIDLHEIEQVEVFKGPVSALYGSGTLGGIVNLVLAPPVYTDQPEWRGRLRLGGLYNPDGWMAHAGASQSAPHHFTSASITARDVDSYRDGDGNRVRNTQFEDQAVTARLGYRWSSVADSDVLVQFHRGNEIGIPGSGSAPLPAQADVTYEDAHRLLVAMHHRLAIDGPTWKSSRLHAYYQQLERSVRIDNFPAGPLLKINPVGRHDTVGARWLNELEAGDHQVGAGLETWRRELDSTRDRFLANGMVQSDRPLPEASEWSYGAFVEDRWTLHRAFSVTTGVRADGLRIENRATPQWESDSINDWNWNAHAGFRWKLAEEWALRGVTAAGYRAPSIEERYQFLALGDGRVKLGNPDLDAEESRFVEFGLEWNHADWSADLTGFLNALRNRVGEEVVDAQALRNANIDRARIQGVEAQANWQVLDPLALRATLAVVRGDDRRADEPLPDIAPLTGSLSMRYRPVASWLAQLRFNAAARQDRVPEGMQETPGWGRLDASLAYLHEHGAVAHQIRLDVLNVTDATWRDHLSTWRGSPHNEPGRSLQLAWEARF